MSDALVRSVTREGLSQIVQICEAFQIGALLPRLRACAEFSRSQGGVDIAVLGQFKAGKSSFLNSLIGTEVLPVDVLPATAVVTRLVYGEKDEARVRYLSGDCKAIAITDLATYATESRNPGNTQQVDTVDVELAALAPFHGIRFMDTPGLGSVFAHNTQASMDWLPKVGGAIVATSAAQPFGEQDLKLLQDVSKHTPEVVLLLTKADLVPEGRLESVLEFIQFQAAQRTSRQHLVFPFSTRPEYGEMRKKVQEHLLREIGGRHEELFERILDHKFRAVAEACRAYLLLAQQAATSAAEARTELQVLLREEQAGLRAANREITVLTRDLQARVRSVSDERFQRFRGEVTRSLQASLREEMAGWKGNLARRSERFRQWLDTALKEEMARVSEHGPGFLGDLLREAEASLQRTVRAFQDRLAKAIKQSLGITFEGARFHAEIPEPRWPDVKIGNIFDTQVDLLWFLIPMGILSPLFERHFLRLLPWEAEKNLSRLANQWAEAVNACVENLVSQAMDFLRQELTTLETLTASAEDRRQAIQEALDTLDALDNPSR